MCLKDNQLHSVNLAAPLQIGNVSVRNRVALAPMSGVTDMPFRQLAWRYGAGLVVTEMVASRELVNNTAESWSRLKAAGFNPLDPQVQGINAVVSVYYAEKTAKVLQQVQEVLNRLT